MDEAEQDQYEARLKELFDSFDSTGTGSLGQEELTDLCHMLHLEEVAPALQQTLLQGNLLGRVRLGRWRGWSGAWDQGSAGLCVCERVTERGWMSVMCEYPTSLGLRD